MALDFIPHSSFVQAENFDLPKRNKATIFQLKMNLIYLTRDTCEKYFNYRTCASGMHINDAQMVVLYFQSGK